MEENPYRSPTTLSVVRSDLKRQRIATYWVLFLIFVVGPVVSRLARWFVRPEIWEIDRLLETSFLIFAAGLVPLMAAQMIGGMIAGHYLPARNSNRLILLIFAVGCGMKVAGFIFLSGYLQRGGGWVLMQFALDLIGFAASLFIGRAVGRYLPAER